MKKTLLLVFVTIFCVSSMFAQGKPKMGKKIPALMKVEQNLTINQTTQLFKQKLQTTDQDQFILMSSREDEVGFYHQKFQQLYKSIPVEGRTVTVHSKDGLVKRLSGNFKPLDDMDVNPALTKVDGFQKATSHVGATKYAWEGDECTHHAAHEGHDHGHEHEIRQPEGELVIFAHPEDKNFVRLAYKYDIYASEPLYRAYVYIDAQNGEILFENHRIHQTDTGGSCSTLYNGTRNITVDFTGSNYRLRQTADGGGIETYDLNNGTNYSNASDVTSGSTSFTSNPTANQAHFGAEQTHQYFMSKHNRNSYNGSGAVIRSYVSYSSNYVNAFWDGSRMTYGDGDGVNYGPLVSLDIVGHEIAHGVTEFTANLVYQRESGALNESFSDIFGESIENYSLGTNDWLMGDDIGAGGSGGALRSMSNPNAFGDPDTYGGTNWYNPNCGTPTRFNDYCGVHINSGVQNFWFYLLCTGQSGTNDIGNSYTVAAIGMDKAAAVAYRNLSVYLSTNSTFADARAGAIQSAIDLYGAGSAEEIAVTNAWYAVGVGDEYGGGTPATCVEEAVTLTITLDNYPEETSWSITSGGTTVASNSYSTANPDGSTVTENINLPAGDYTFTINDAYGDGICCSYGNGSYSLDAASGNIASGGAFGSSASTSFCTEGGGSSCTVGASCDDNDVCTTGDVYDANCNCAGTFADSDGDGTCDANDQCNGPEPGTACNDGDASTTGDVIQSDCSCAGTSVCTPGTACNDNDPCTTGDVYDSNCNCAGTYADSDGDGTCDADDQCNGPEPGSSCDDGDANTTGDVIQSDCTCAGTPSGGGPETVFAHYFETGWDGWTDGGSDCFRYSGGRSWEGSYSIRIRDNSGTASSMTSSSYDLSGYSSVDLKFYFYPNSMENGEDFWVRYYNGSSWTTVATYASGTSFNNNTFYSATVTLSANDYNLASNAQFRIQCDASANADRVYIDEVSLTGTTATGIMAGAAVASGQTIREVQRPTYGFGPADAQELEEMAAEKISVFPNPATSELNVRLVEGAKQIRIFSITGQQVFAQEVTEDLQENIDISALRAGTYLIGVQVEGRMIYEKFIKL